MSTEADWDRWFSARCVRPAQTLWGPEGWRRLSEEMQLTEVQARLAMALFGNGRTDYANMNDENAAALGRHTASVFAAYSRWCEGDL